MESVIGIQFKDFVLLAADKINVFSIMVVKNDENKIHKLSNSLAMGVTGESGDSKQFADFVAKNIALYNIRNGFEMHPAAAANYIQKTLADYLRSRTPYQVNLLLAGYDEVDKQPHLHFMDYLATACKVPYGAHGYGAFFIMGLLDRAYKADSTVAEGVEMMKKCVAEIQKRLVINLPAFNLAIIDKDGFRMLDDIIVDPKRIGLVSQGQLPAAEPMTH